MVSFTDSHQVSCIDNEDDNGKETEDSTEECDSSSSSEGEEESGAVVSVDDVANSKPSFGNISVSNSSDVHFGNKTFYQGPVTIKQFVYSKNSQNETSIGDDGSVLRDDRLILDCAQIGEEKFNEGFVKDEDNEKKVYAQNGRVVGNVYQSQSLGHKWVGGFSRQQTLLMATLGILFLLSLVILTVTLTAKHFETINNNNNNQNNEDYIGTPIESPIDSDAFNATLPNNVRIISRLEWLAQPPVEPPNELNHPVPYVIIWHTATENCSDQATCVFHVRTIQTFHIDSRHWWDIAYNFLVGGDGNAYEGRGWKKEGSHTFDYNKRAIGIAFIGTFISIKPPQWQINACRVLINMGVKQGYISKDYKLLAAKQLIGTQAPGAVLYEEIKKWPHWSAQP